MKRLSLILLALLSLSLWLGSSALAIKKKGIIKGACAGCITEDYLDEFIGYAVRKDYDSMNALLGKYCFDIDGLRFSLIKSGFTTVKLRIYVGEKSVVLWTVREAISN